MSSRVQVASCTFSAIEIKFVLPGLRYGGWGSSRKVPAIKTDRLVAQTKRQFLPVIRSFRKGRMLRKISLATKAQKLLFPFFYYTVDRGKRVRGNVNMNRSASFLDGLYQGGRLSPLTK